MQKIFTPAEQSVIEKAEKPEIKVWELWSRKEAAYKIYNRQTNVRAFMPLKIECVSERVDKTYTFGEVKIFETIYFSKTLVRPDFILTFAATSESVLYEIHEISELEINSLIIKDISGIPYLYYLNPATIKPISISHHGRFCSYITT